MNDAFGGSEYFNTPWAEAKKFWDQSRDKSMILRRVLTRTLKNELNNSNNWLITRFA